MTEMTTAVKKKGTLIPLFAERFHIDPDLVLPILKATAFKVTGGEVSNEQMVALLSVANQYGLNPFTREIFAFEDKFKGIVPVVSVDGWSRIVNNATEFDGVEFNNSPDELTAPEGGKTAYKWIECVIYRKDRQHPIKLKEYFDEVYQPPRGVNKTFGPWQSHPKRMHRHKVFIQCARLAFGFGGIYDEDEAVRIIDGQAETIPAGQQERSATARIAAALDLGGTQGQLEGQQAAADAAAKQAVPFQGKVVPFDDIELSIVAAKSQDEMKLLLEQIGAHPDSDKRREVVTKWHNRAKELAPPLGPKQKEQGSVQRANNLIRQMKESKSLDDVNAVLDFCNGYTWEASVYDRIKIAHGERVAELQPK